MNYDGIYKIRIPEKEIELYEKIIRESKIYKNTEDYAGKYGDSFGLAYALLCEKYPKEKERFNNEKILMETISP